MDRIAGIHDIEKNRIPLLITIIAYITNLKLMVNAKYRNYGN